MGWEGSLKLSENLLEMSLLSSTALLFIQVLYQDLLLPYVDLHEKI